MERILEELTVRCRASGREGVEAAGLWPPDEAHRAFMADQRRSGERLRRELLAAVLGAEDAAATGASAVRIFGNRGQHFRARLPYTLACGHQLGSLLCALAGGTSARTETAGRLGAVFHLAVSLFDTICDGYPRLLEQVKRAFDERVLLALLEGDDTVRRDFARRASEADRAEVRLVLKALGWFLAQVRELHQSAPDAQRPTRSLVEALRAQHASVAPAGRTPSELLDVARTKSVFAFKVVQDVALLAAGRVEPAAQAAVERLVSSVGAAFWLIDDLVDVALDHRTGALNALLLKAGGRLVHSPDPERSRALAARLAQSDVVERVAADLRGYVAEVAGTLAAPRLPASEAARLRLALGSYMRSALSP